jgi:hypothetical protein
MSDFGLLFYLYLLPIILSAFLCIIAGESKYRSASREMREDGMWFIAIIPSINFLIVGVLIFELCLGDVKIHPRTKDAVYFLPLLSLGLLYFI